ncbi:MAG TPA: PaaX family transcriptional regulator C-terminal domain-containing protein [Streptosporangiaceae bacterium]|nr:PaaX family transcriptional regulator C-terminal domain-containing protein [Streptosporangiaceae bacterium]
MTAAGESSARRRRASGSGAGRPEGAGRPPAGEADTADLRLPRLQEGARPQHLIITLFGDYWWGNTEHLPSAGLVALVSEFDISATSARAALSRLGRRGLLTSSKAGRRTFYGPTPRTEVVMREGADRIFSFGVDDASPWDGTWLVVAFSVPEEQRDVRHALRMRLRWLGFAALYDGVWVSPRADAGATEQAIRDCGVQQASIFRATSMYSAAGSGLGRHPLSAWNLDELRRSYDDFIKRFEPVYERVVSGEIRAWEALVERTAIMDTWRVFPALDPDLPAEVLPDGWPRQRAHEIFAQVYDSLGPLAEARFRQIISKYSPELAGLAHHLTTRARARPGGYRVAG